MRTKLVKRINDKIKEEMNKIAVDQYDEDMYLFGYEKDELVAMVSLSAYEEKIFAKAYGNSKYYDKLFKKAKNILKDKEKLYFFGENDYFDNIKYEYSELLMKAKCTKKLYAVEDTFTIEKEDDTVYFLKGAKNVGELSLYVGKNTVTIYGVLIYEKYRNKGYGKKFMELVHNYIFKELEKDIILHVVSDNLSAVKLYRSMGYKVEEELKIYSSDF